MPGRILETAESVPAMFVAVHMYSPVSFTVILDRFTKPVSSVPSLNHCTVGVGSPSRTVQLMVNGWPSMR